MVGNYSHSQVFLQILVTPSSFPSWPSGGQAPTQTFSQDPGPDLGHLLCPSSISSSYTHSSPRPSSPLSAAIVTRDSSSEGASGKEQRCVFSRRTWASSVSAPALWDRASRCVQFDRGGKPVPGAARTGRGEGRLRISRGEPGAGAGAGDPFLLILSPGIPGFGTGRLSSVGGGAQAGCMSWAAGQENTMFPSALAAALGLAASQTAASPASPSHIPRLLCSALFLCFDVTAPSRPLSSIDDSRAWLLWGLGGRTAGALGTGGVAAGALDPFVYAEHRRGGGGRRARAARLCGDHTHTPEESRGARKTGFPEERCLHMRQGTGPQFRSWGDISKEMTLKIQTPESFVSCVSWLWFFWVVL